MIATTSGEIMRGDETDSAHLLVQARAGDAESFWALCEPLHRQLIRQALALCRDEALAQDLAQETLIAAWNSIHRYNGGCRLATWLCSILLHKHRSLLRRSRWWRMISSFTGEHEASVRSLVDGYPSPDRAVQFSERSRAILSALERLPTKQRAVIFLRFYADESLEGIAIAMRCSVGTVKSRLYHALEKLRRMRIVNEELS